MLIALLILGAVAIFVNLIAIIVNLLMVTTLQRDSREILTLEKINTGRTAAIERLVVALHSMFAAEMAQGQFPPGPSSLPDTPMPPGMRRIFRTEDGRHQAENFEDLMHQIADDDKYRVANPNDMEQLRRAFDEYKNQMDEEDDEEIPGDEWKKGKEDEPEAE